MRPAVLLIVCCLLGTGLAGCTGGSSARAFTYTPELYTPTVIVRPDGTPIPVFDPPGDNGPYAADRVIVLTRPKDTDAVERELRRVDFTVLSRRAATRSDADDANLDTLEVQVPLGSVNTAVEWIRHVSGVVSADRDNLQLLGE